MRIDDGCPICGDILEPWAKGRWALWSCLVVLHVDIAYAWWMSVRGRYVVSESKHCLVPRLTPRVTLHRKGGDCGAHPIH